MCEPKVRASDTFIQHSAGSGKSNSIAWLAHQLIGLKRDDKEVFNLSHRVTDDACLTTRSRHHQAVSCRWARPWATLSTPATFASLLWKGRDHRLDGAEVPSSSTRSD